VRGGFLHARVGHKDLSRGLGAAQLITLGVMPLWSRQYGVADFAALGVWASVVAVVSMAAEETPAPAAPAAPAGKK
jgi:hypothetical protein